MGGTPLSPPALGGAVPVPVAAPPPPPPPPLECLVMETDIGAGKISGEQVDIY